VPRPATITVASAVEAVEAALVLVAAILAGIDTGAGRSYQLSSGIAITVIGIAMAALLGLVAVGLRRPRRWTRTPALLTQLFTGIVGIYLVQGAKYGWGVPAIALAVLGFATLLAPPSTRALTVGLPQPADRHRKR
jgi:MYXO-CTERM domain-containing protein